MKNEIENYQAYLVVERGLSAASVEAYVSDIRRFINVAENNGITSLKEISALDIQRYLSDAESDNINTNARRVATLASFFRYAMESGAINLNPAAGLKPPKVIRKTPTTILPEEFAAMIKAVEMYKPEAKRNLAMLEVLYSCGLRVSEIIRLRSGDVNLRLGSISVRSGEDVRMVPLDGETKKRIETYISGYRNFLPVKEGFQDTLFLNNRGGELSRVMVFNIIKHLAFRAGIRRNVSPHTLRHSFAANMIKSGMDIMSVRGLLGHKSVLTTEIYGRIG